MDSQHRVTLGKLSDFLERLPNVKETDHCVYTVKSGKWVVSFKRKSPACVPEKDGEIWKVLAECSHGVELRPPTALRRRFEGPQVRRHGGCTNKTSQV